MTKTWWVGKGREGESSADRRFKILHRVVLNMKKHGANISIPSIHRMGCFSDVVRSYARGEGKKGKFFGCC